MAKPINLTNDNIDETLQDGLAVLYFWAPWCGPCRIVDPVIDELAEDFHGKVKIYKVNTNEEQNLAVTFGITSLPVIMFLYNGGKLSKVSGMDIASYANKDRFAREINTLLEYPEDHLIYISRNSSFFWLKGPTLEKLLNYLNDNEQRLFVIQENISFIKRVYTENEIVFECESNSSVFDTTSKQEVIDWFNSL